MVQLALALAASAQDGASVRLSDWDLTEAGQVRWGQLTVTSEGSYIGGLRGQPAVVALPAYRPLQVLRQGVVASAPGQAQWVGDHQLRLEPAPGGYSGAYFQVEPCDARGYQFCLWVRGQGRLELKLADADWLAREDGLVAGQLTLTGEWQLLRADLPAALQPQSFSSFSLLGQGTLEFGAAGLVPTEQAAPAPPTQAQPERALKTGNACWIWDTTERLDGPYGWIDFLARREIKVLFMQLPAQLDDRLAGLLERLHSAGFEVQALTGDRHDILPETRARVLDHMDQLFAFQQRPAAQRFEGVHFDIEPYLLPGFGGARRELILQRYLGVLEVLVGQCHAHGLPAAFDVPCWFDPISLEVGGVRQGLLEHILQRCDQVAVMSYRTSSARVLESGAEERRIAKKWGKRLWLGLETTPLPDEVSYTFEGEPRHGSAGPGEVIYLDEHFYLGPRPQVGWCWKVSASEKSLADNLSFAHLPRQRFAEVRAQVQAEVPVAIHDLRYWMSLDPP